MVQAFTPAILASASPVRSTPSCSNPGASCLLRLPGPQAWAVVGPQHALLTSRPCSHPRRRHPRHRRQLHPLLRGWPAVLSGYAPILAAARMFRCCLCQQPARPAGAVTRTPPHAPTPCPAGSAANGVTSSSYGSWGVRLVLSASWKSFLNPRGLAQVVNSVGCR